MTTQRVAALDNSAGTFDESRDVLLHLSVRSRVFRHYLTGKPESIICKELLGEGASQRARHELKILERLAGIDGIPSLVRANLPPQVISLQDTGCVPLRQALTTRPPDTQALLDLALALANIISAIHQRGVVHNDINPANILLAGPGRKPVLIDFHLATTFAEAQPNFTHYSEIVGTLDYLAPEQTGRTGRSVDLRADLYAFGATLYELATGHLPFASGDPLQLIHDILARTPTPPIMRDGRIPRTLSDIIMRLLEKEPDLRYQSATGLAHDLARLRECHARGENSAFVLCERDFALRLSPPSRLVGREAEISALHAAFDNALQSGGRGVLVTGAPGVGKTALINELRPVATARRGWFISGKFDQYRRDGDGAPLQALRALGRLLLAEPETDLALFRANIGQAVGVNIGLVAAISPEFSTLLGVEPEIVTGDPLQNEARLFQAALGLMRAVASPTRPVVMVLDDLQWSGPVSIRLIDAILMDDAMRGLLLVGAYRDAEVDETHPLSAMLTRWERLGATPLLLSLKNLAPPDLATMLREMLRLEPHEAASLAEVIGARSNGNPFDTVQLLNALRRDGTLVSGSKGWSWDAATIRRFVGEGDVVDLLALRIGNLAVESRTMLKVLACLGGEVELELLHVASGVPVILVEEHLAPALEDALLIMENGTKNAVRFRHDRVQQAAYARMTPAGRVSLHLEIARRLGAQKGLEVIAAAQYLPGLDAVTEPAERRAVARLFRHAGEHARAGANYVAEERYLAAALKLAADGTDEKDSDVVAALEVAWHASLYSLGRYDEADAVYASIEKRCRNPQQLADPACVQIDSLTSRRRQGEAVTLGVNLIGRLGIPVPAEADLDAEVRRLIDALYAWVAGEAKEADMRRPEVTDPRILALAKIFHHSLGPSFYSGDRRSRWLSLRTHRLWVEHGPCASLVTCFGGLPMMTISINDFRTGYLVARHALSVGEARHFEPQISWVRHCFALFVQHWFEPLEDSIAQAQRAREELLRGGDLQYACFSYHTEVSAQLDCAPTLDDVDIPVEAAIAFARRTGNAIAEPLNIAHRQLLRALRGETNAPGSFTEQSFEETAFLASLKTNYGGAITFHILRALSAAIFGDTPALQHHAAIAVKLRRFLEGFYPVALAWLLQGLSLAQRVKAAPDEERAALLEEFDKYRDWMAERAADAPVNFLHFLKWLEAERAWALNDFWAAAAAFDSALREVQSRRRPWHRALITERAGLFHMAYGLEHSARLLLAEARHLYEAWGAVGKVRALEQDHPFLRADASGRYSVSARRSAGAGNEVSADTIDMLAVLRASQALSSETNLERLQSRVRELLGALTGATAVKMVLWQDDPKGWHLSAAGQTESVGIPVEQAAMQGLLPLSVFRYAERTRQPLLVADATRDDRFARDPYVAGLDQCSILAVPLLRQGNVHAVLLLENRVGRGAFSTDRLDAVMLIAGQLTVSLDNARLYASLEQKVADRTEALKAANRQLLELSTTDALTGLANRRRFDEVLAGEWLRAARPQMAVGAIMLDIDEFKLYNDHYGHQAGDRCLQRVAAAVRDTLRQGSDLLARYGGEEFAIVLPGADLAAVQRVAERARAAVEALNEPHEMARHGIVTISAGIAALIPAAGVTPERLFAQADSALYEAKRKGRNQVAAAI